MAKRNALDLQLQRVSADIAQLAQLVQAALQASMLALRQLDVEAARRLVAADSTINDLHGSIELQAQTILATQQPIVATDLRLVRAYTAVATELERIGDYAKSIARRVPDVAAQPALHGLPDGLWEQAESAQRMLQTALDALARRDAALAETLATSDVAVDALEDAVRRELFQEVRENVAWLEAGVALLEVAHALERVADRATNIGERVIYVISAQQTELND
jgi:phosphate transport system protein